MARKHPHGHKKMADGKSNIYTKPAKHAEVRGTVKGLNQKELDFIRLYEGDPLEAAKLAGYSAPWSAVKRLMKKPAIAEAVHDRERKTIEPLVASRIKRQEFWTNTMQDEKTNMANRLKASELLGKSEGDFIERHIVEDDTLEARLRRLKQLRDVTPEPKAIEMKPCDNDAITFEPIKGQDDIGSDRATHRDSENTTKNSITENADVIS